MNAFTILDRLDTIVNRDDFTRALALAVLNENIKWIENEGDWSFMEYLDESQVLVNGTSQYNIPTRFKREIDVSLIDTSYNQRFLNKLRSTRIDRDIGTTNQSQRPTHYYYFGGYVYMFPVPATGQGAGDTLRQRVYVYVADLTDSTGSSNELTVNHANLLIAMSARDLFSIFEDEDKAKYWNEGKENKSNFVAEWDAFLKKEGKKAASPVGTRMSMRVK